MLSGLVYLIVLIAMLVSSEVDISGIQSSEEALLEIMWDRELHHTVGTQLMQFRTESTF